MDLPAPVATQIQPPNPMQSLNMMGGMLDLKKSQQALQIGQQTLAQQTMETQKQKEVRDFYQNYDPSDHVGPDGTTSLESSFADPAFKKLSLGKPAVIENLLGIKSKQLAAKKALLDINGQAVGQFASMAGTLAENPDVIEGNDAARGVIGDAFSRFSEMGPDNARVVKLFSGIVTNPNGNPKHMHGAMRSLQLMGADALAQRSQQNPATGLADVGPSLQPTATNPQEGIVRPVGTPIDKGLQPGQRQTLETDPQTNTRVWVVRDVNGNVISTTPASQGPPTVGRTAPAAPPPAPPGSPGVIPQARGAAPTQAAPARPGAAPPTGAGFGAVGAGDAIKLAQAQVERARSIGDSVGLNRHINDTLLRLSSSTASGPGTEVWHNALGMVAGPVGSNAISDYQTIGALLDRQAASATQAMGLPDTDSGLATAKSLTGHTGYEPAALQAKVKLTDAILTGAEHFKNGLIRVVGTSTTPNLSEYQRFRNDWAENYTPDVFRMDNAQRRGRDNGIPDEKNPEIAEITRGKSHSQLMDLARRSRNLDALTRTGYLPPPDAR